MIQGDQNKTIKKKEKSYKKYYVDLNSAVANNLVSLEAAIKYLESNIKVNGIKKKLGESVLVNSANDKEKKKNTILVQADTKMKFSKRYIKYLVKKFLKRENIASYLRVISQGSSTYMVKLFNRDTA
ncbi:MAG: eL22 family ribosomal protein [bacterium]|jgi:large subunit ribosomal protein L22e